MYIPESQRSVRSSQRHELDVLTNDGSQHVRRLCNHPFVPNHDLLTLCGVNVCEDAIEVGITPARVDEVTNVLVHIIAIASITISVNRSARTLSTWDRHAFEELHADAILCQVHPGCTCLFAQATHG